MLLNFHLFDGLGRCLFTLNREERDDRGEDTQLLYGFLYSLKSFAQKITPSLGADGGAGCFFTYQTSAYQLVYLEMPTGVRLVLIVSRDAPARSNDYFRQLLKDFYRSVYVEYHVKNPLRTANQPIDSAIFRDRLVDFFARMYN